jgi:benzoyl-CoA reductase/2-hydroxyglutaryl-CoA dehydratase subunit BcrC/BadD/HgdB
MNEGEVDGATDEAIDPRCTVVRSWLSTLIDGECGAAMSLTLLRHLDRCAGCKTQYDLQARFKSLITSKCGRDRVSERAPGWRSLERRALVIGTALLHR